MVHQHEPGARWGGQTAAVAIEAGDELAGEVGIQQALLKEQGDNP
jgi:hypothetical protein